MKTYKVEKVRRVLYVDEVFFDGEWRDLAACVNCETVGFLRGGCSLGDYDRLNVCGCETPDWYRGLFGASEIVSKFVKKYYGEVE